jgi:hypothetical protein
MPSAKRAAAIRPKVAPAEFSPDLVRLLPVPSIERYLTPGFAGGGGWLAASGCAAAVPEVAEVAEVEATRDAGDADDAVARGVAAGVAR